MNCSRYYNQKNFSERVFTIKGRFSLCPQAKKQVSGQETSLDGRDEE
jgi:hypothetical protein